MITNATFNVSSFFNCEDIQEYKEKYEYDPVWRQTDLGCSVLRILQSMYHFNVNYVNINVSEDDIDEKSMKNVDIWVRPMSVVEEYLDKGYPIHAIFQWRFGFLLRYKQEKIVDNFYSLPFTTRVWSCVIFILFLSSIVFYILSYWEKRFVGGECQYDHELLLAFSAFCQHMWHQIHKHYVVKTKPKALRFTAANTVTLRVNGCYLIADGRISNVLIHFLPLQANLYSRRIAYLIFILCAYMVHCFYTSNLLCHLVNDKDRDMDLRGLAASDFEIVIIKDMNLVTEKRIQQVSLDKNFSLVENKLRNVKIMNVSSALEAVRNTRTAVLSDYTSLYGILKKMFNNDVLCELIEVDLYSEVKKYFFTSKEFPYKEKFKVGILRAQETGILRRLLSLKTQQAFSCKDNASPEAPGFKYTFVPFAILLASVALSLVIMILEILSFKGYVFPYLD